MSNDLTFMGMPQEILLLILTLFFSDSVVNTRKPIRRSIRNKPIDPKPLPSCLAVLLVNKVLNQIGFQCFHKFTIVWSETIFSKMWEPTFSWVYHQVPWNRIRYISGGYVFAESLNRALEEESIRINHLQEIAIRYK